MESHRETESQPSVLELSDSNEDLQTKEEDNEQKNPSPEGEDTDSDSYVSASDCDFVIVEKSDIEPEENTHLQKKSEISQEEDANVQSSIFSFLSDITGSFVTSVNNAAGSFLSSIGEKVGIISKKTDNEGFTNLKIVLVGRCGIGKSTLFNSLAMKEWFMTDSAKQFNTEHCEIFHGVRDGRHITVIDTPGFFSSHLSNEQVTEKIQTDIKMAPPGPFLFLLIVEVDNFTQEDTETANIIEKMLDGNKGNMMVVFTQGCRLKSTIEEYIQGSDENLQKLLEKCEQRCLVLNNTAMNLQHLKELFKVNDQLIQKDGFWKDGNVEEAERVSSRRGSLNIVPPAMSGTPSEGSKNCDIFPSLITS